MESALIEIDSVKASFYGVLWKSTLQLTCFSDEPTGANKSILDETLFSLFLEVTGKFDFRLKIGN